MGNAPISDDYSRLWRGRGPGICSLANRPSRKWADTLRVSCQSYVPTQPRLTQARANRHSLEPAPSRSTRIPYAIPDAKHGTSEDS
jgi:hypothetical protein